MKIWISEFLRIFLDFILIFQVFFIFISLLKNHEKGLLFRSGPVKLMWRGADTWRSHASPRQPTWTPTSHKEQLG